ncbi:hypothetical protein DW1_1038 [Proteiniborus sp. DW1]|uniref:DUF445 domain-containing protein n=1 Tax=Proteiniborus sp. DW1 TaxID=1889883 RepID=UPI00092E126F|nr:DUF445 family protein [Proteiniborus sp. DW1]SCG82634.1 hypothetical protein DW1_1038 [Proteiniborus sp. DW1]
MLVVKVLVFALIGALIGWITNLIAIKLLFRPFYPIRVPVLNFSIQGLIPKRRDEIASSIGNVIEQQLLSFDELVDKVMEDKNISQIKTTIKNKINEVIRDKLPSIIPSFLKNMIYSYIDDFIEKDGDAIINDLIRKSIDKASKDISISEIIEDKIKAFEIEKIEEIIISIAKTELKHIEILGGVLGFIIGVVQGILAVFV